MALFIYNFPDFIQHCYCKKKKKKDYYYLWSDEKRTKIPL